MVEHRHNFHRNTFFFLFWLQINHISTVNRLPVPSPICLRKKIQVQVKKTEQKKKEKVIEVTCWSMKSGTLFQSLHISYRRLSDIYIVCHCWNVVWVLMLRLLVYFWKYFNEWISCLRMFYKKWNKRWTVWICE